MTSATAFDEAHEDNEAAHSAMAHASAFVKFAFAVSKGLIKETQFSIKPEDGEIEAYLQSRLRNCILPPLDQSDGLGGGAANGALQQLAQSVSMHAESSNASNQVRIRELDAAEKRADEKKDRLSKFQAGTLNMISMASSTDFMRKGEITPTLREFINSDSAAYSPWWTCGTLATTKAIAAETWTAIKTELVKKAPEKVPIITPYKP